MAHKHSSSHAHYMSVGVVNFNSWVQTYYSTLILVKNSVEEKPTNDDVGRLNISRLEYVMTVTHNHLWVL